MSSPSPAFELCDVSRRYGNRWALARLSFSLPAGEALLLTGHNGAGKSTLLRVLATALPPTAGQLKIFGLDSQANKEQVRAKVALLSHASFLYEDLTAEQNLAFLARLWNLSQPRTQVSEVLAKVGLSARSRHPVRQFSAGMRKRLAIARVLLKKPALALLDEPFGELDPDGMALMEQLVRSLRSNGTTVVLATHLIDQGLSLCGQRLHLEAGRSTAA